MSEWAKFYVPFDQGDHFPDHMKFPHFSSRGKQRLPGIECLPIWSTVIVSYQWKTGWGQIVNYLTVRVVTAGGSGWGDTLPSRLGGIGERRKLPRTLDQKTSFEVFRAWKNTPDFTSPDHFGIPWLFQVFQMSGHPVRYILGHFRDMSFQASLTLVLTT